MVIFTLSNGAVPIKAYRRRGKRHEQPARRGQAHSFAFGA